MSMSDSGADMFLNAMLGVTPIPTTLYLAVTETDPDESQDGDTLFEPNDPDYARQPFDTGGAYWTPSDGGASFYTENIVFPPSTVDWPVIRYWIICDAVTSGTPYMWGEFSEGFQVPVGQILTIESESFGVNLSPETETVVG